ncbi:hypothetical protein ALI44B_01120 [Leifsonia sp. ALI-44-B]|nr:hypothetical protein ALI44B_01120 [Leifsonia sp. ALI-44-B]
MLIPLLLAQPSLRMVRINTAGVSLAIESGQLAAQRFAGGGHIADVDDFIFNVVGGAAGFALFLLLMRIHNASTLVGRFRWASSCVDAARVLCVYRRNRTTLLVPGRGVAACRTPLDIDHFRTVAG